MQGKIYHLSNDGYGFISSKELPFERIFFHWTALEQTTLRFLQLRRGMMAEFELLNDPIDGYKAIKMTILPEELLEAQTERIK